MPPLAHEEGVGFFLARARAVKPDFQADEAVSEICRRLDDLPLALELAAARVKALSSTQILERLEQRLPLLTGGARDLPERQRTLRATIEWSYELLAPEEQQLFSRLAVFLGGCTLEAAEEVAEAELDTLHSLVDKSLVRHIGERYWMLETIREYAGERLRASGDLEVTERRHARALPRARRFRESLPRHPGRAALRPRHLGGGQPPCCSRVGACPRRDRARAGARGRTRLLLVHQPPAGRGAVVCQLARRGGECSQRAAAASVHGIRQRVPGVRYERGDSRCTETRSLSPGSSATSARWR